MIDSPRAIYYLARVNPAAAKAILGIRSLLRHPTSPRKCRSAYKSSRELLEGDLLIGRWINRLSVVPEDLCVRFSSLNPLRESRPRSKTTIGVICHLYYADVIEEMAKYLGNISQEFDLLVSTDTEEKKSQIERLRFLPQVLKLIIRVVPNVGRDIAPKLITFNDMVLSYDLLLFVHGKKSDFDGDLSGWRRHLLESLLGSEMLVHSILCAFEEIPELGMISPQHYSNLRGLGWAENKKTVADLCERILRNKFRFGHFDFPSGSMFWCRPRALRALWELNLKIDDFPIEAGQINGTIAHAIERLFYVSCEVEGLRWLKITNDRTSALSGRVVEIESAAELRKVIGSTGRQLLVPVTKFA